MIEYKQGDLFSTDWTTPTIKLVPHCCNDVDRFGSGFAGAVAKHWPQVKQRYHDWHRLGIDIESGKPFKLGQFQTVKVRGDDLFSLTYAINMIGQRDTVSSDNPKPVKYGPLYKCIEGIGMMLRNFSNQHYPVHNIEVITVKFGSDLAGGDWAIIEEMVQDQWVSDIVNVTVWELDR